MITEKKQGYYRGIREDIIGLVDERVGRVLDIGCAAGFTGERLKKKGIKEVVGVELNENAYKEAAKRLDKVFLGDIEKIKLPFKDGYFDCIIYADVLEHLVDPWSLLLRHKRLLKSGGVIVASLPNVRHYRVIKKLLKGRWDYEHSGVLDSTHLRFFTLKSAKDMLSNAGFQIGPLIYNISASKIKKFLNRLLGGALNEVLSEQFLIKAVKT